VSYRLGKSRTIILAELVQAAINLSLLLVAPQISRWLLGSLSPKDWENRATQHYGVADYGDNRRILHRVTIDGDVPVSVDGRTSVLASLNP
jgi:hypothetical protein